MSDNNYQKDGSAMNTKHYKELFGLHMEDNAKDNLWRTCVKDYISGKVSLYAF